MPLERSAAISGRQWLVAGLIAIWSLRLGFHISARTLLTRIRGWLAKDGRLFIHVFTHRDQAYRFDHKSGADRIATYFFTGGIMPSRGLIRHFEVSFEVEQEWQWNGRHYQRTALDWRANFDANTPAVDHILADVHGAEAAIWRRRWRLFFLATAQLFGHARGEAWGVRARSESHSKHHANNGI